MTDDNNNGYNEAQAIGGAVTIGALAPVVGMSLTGNAAEIKKPSPEELAKYAKGDVISPAEAKFWQEQADRTPELYQKHVLERMDKNPLFLTGALGLGTGAMLGGASFTPIIKGKWKWLTGLTSAGALAVGAMGMVASHRVSQARQAHGAFAGVLMNSPELRQELAQHLSKTVTDKDIQNYGLEQAVVMHAMEFSTGIQTPRANALVQQAIGSNTARELQRAEESKAGCNCSKTQR